MSRCKACDKEFSESEELAKEDRDGEQHPRELCSGCFTIAMRAAHGNDWVDYDLAEVDELVNAPPGDHIH